MQVNQTNIRTLVLTQRNNNLNAAQADQDNDATSSAKSTSTPSFKSPLEDVLDRMLYKLDLEARRTGRVMVFELEDVIKTVERGNFCTSTQALLLLRCCGANVCDKSKTERSESLKKVVKLLKSVVKFDVSHYNAILKVHLENENSIDVSAFLAEMEAEDVHPNRASYQHLVGLYCMNGDIDKATTVLEHMKAEDISINEFVFHSLLRGHTINKDTESVNEVLQIMENSALLPGADTYTALLTAAAKARDWDRVEELLVESKNKDINLNAGDYFKVIIALCESKMSVQANSLLSHLPKRAGYFQEMRSALPQIICSGDIDTALNIFDDFKVTNSSGSEHDGSKHANFLGAMIATSPADPADCAKAIYKLYERNHTDVVTVYVRKCVEFGQAQKIQALADEVKEKTGEDIGSVLRIESHFLFTRDAIKRIADMDNLEELIRVLEGLGYKLDLGNIASVLVAQSYNIDAELPGSCLMRIKKKVPRLMMWSLQENMVRFLLEKGDMRHMLMCTGFMLASSLGRLQQKFMRHELARCYLKTMSMDNLVSMIFVTKKVKQTDGTANKDLIEFYEILQNIYYYQENDRIQPDMTAVEVLNGVLRELNKHKIGVPRQKADRLKDLHDDEEMHGLLETAVADFESDYWTEEKENQFLEQRKKLYIEADRSSGFTRTNPNTDRKYSGRYFEIPKDLAEMQRVKDIVKRRGAFNPLLTDKLISALAVDNQPSEAVKELRAANEENSSFDVSPSVAREVSQSFIRNDDLAGCEDFFLNHGDTWFFDDLLAIIEAFASKGETEKVIELLKLNHTKKFVHSDDRRNTEYNNILKIYEDAGDIETLQKVVDAILSKNRSGRMLGVRSSLVRAHMLREDIPAAMEAFEKGSKEFKILPAKLEFTKKLIEEENVDGLQKIVDISIGVIGEEQTLYDLTECFLQLGRRAQAKKMLETPGLMYNQKRISTMMRSFINNGDLEGLQDFVRLSKNVFGSDRDYLYLTWVKAVKSAEKIGDIWLEIQEEGHAPSTELKTEIAISLRAANLEIPFDTTDLDLDGVRETQNKRTEDGQASKPTMSPTKKPAEPRLSTIKKPAETSKPKVLRWSNVQRAIAANDVTALTEELKSKVSRNDSRFGLEYLIAENKLDEAESFITEGSYQPQYIWQTVQKFMRALKEARGLEAVEKFISGLPETHLYVFRTENMLNIFKMDDPKDFIAAVKSSDVTNIKPANIKHSTFCEQVSKNPQVIDQLEQLSAEGSVPATVLLARYSCGNGDSENLTKYWSMIDEKDRELVTRRIVVDVYDLDKLRWVSSTLNHDRQVVLEATNLCLSRKNDKSLIVEGIDYALEHGVTLQEIKTRCLKLAVGLSSFKHAEEAKRIIKERAVVETELQAKELLDKEQQAKELLDKEQQANL